jgi:DNA modification methylase
MTTELPDNRLYFGDNLDILREDIGDASVDLIYLDPPFNSARDYNILFASPRSDKSEGGKSEAQIVAFKDSWQWGMPAEREFDEIVHGGCTDAARMIQAMRRFLGENDMMAYLVMMTRRLLELRRVLKPAGSLYLHCDPAASHYLKIMLDSVFGKTRYASEISWKRSSAHNDARQGRKLPGNIRDVLLFYTRSETWTWNWLYTPYDENYVRRFYKHVDEKTGRRYRLDNLTAAKPGGDVSYDFHGTRPYKGRYWAYSRENMEKFHAEGRLHFPKNGGTPSYKRYLDEMPGVPLQNDWADIRPVPSDEYLGYPTQKPLALLERIVQASSNEGEVVLDPFCGCGTAVHAAQKLGRKWIGIDITHLAIALIEKRMKDAFPGIGFTVYGTPRDLEGARDLAARDKYQFQWWACSLVNAQPWQGRKKGADGGIDGLIYFQDEPKAYRKIVVSVKGGGNVSVAMMRDLAGVLEREKAEIGLFVTLAPPTRPMLAEAAKAGFYKSPTLGGNFPRLQILSIEGLLEGRERPVYPDLSQGGLTFRKAKREEKKADQKPLF